MESKLEQEVMQFRQFNRFYTNIMGYIGRHVLETEFSLPEGRLLHELGKNAPCTMKSISDELQMDAGYLSRIIKKFESMGLLTKMRSEKDGRAQVLTLTEAGRKCVDEVNRASSAQIEKLLEPVPEEAREVLLRDMAEIEALLSSGKGL